MCLGVDSCETHHQRVKWVEMVSAICYHFFVVIAVFVALGKLKEIVTTEDLMAQIKLVETTTKHCWPIFRTWRRRASR